MGKTHTSIIGEGVNWFGLGAMIILLKLLQFIAVSLKTFVPKKDRAQSFTYKNIYYCLVCDREKLEAVGEWLNKL